MKKLLAKILAVVSAFVFAIPLAACGGNDAERTVKVYMPEGAPSIALASLMSEGYGNTRFTVVNAATVAAHVTGANNVEKADMAIMPINAAATLYNAGNDIVMLTVNTHGNLFLVGDGASEELASLNGKRLGVIGMGQIPDQVLRMLLDKANIEYEISETAVDGKVAIRYAESAGILLPLLKQGIVDYALLPEPAATTAVNNLNKSIVLDIQSAWKSNYDYEYPQACLVAQGEFVNENKEFVDKFINDLKASDGWAEANPESALNAIKAHLTSDIVSSFSVLDEGMVKRCNIRTEYAYEVKENCDKYFELLTKLPTGIGTMALAKVPDENFYYGK